jgi:D-alanyl-lipoteichoic acid acyltransferase DltB (MBOAT superfamily)
MAITFDGFLFWIFLAAVWLLWMLSPSVAYRRALLAGSGLIYYYLVQPNTIILLVVVTVFTYLTATGIQRATLPQLRQRLLWLGIGMAAASLIVYKYAGAMGTAGVRLAEIAPGLRDEIGQFVLPLGISYYIFQAIGYLIDCYRKQAPEDSSILDYSTYLTFFPHITAGPILRSMDFLPQLRERLRLSSAMLWEGLTLITFGLFKKMVIADNLADTVNIAYGNLAGSNPVQVIIATYAYAVQIYCDFSGYTDVAIGAALLFGLKFPANFRWPYLSESIADFWNRWHISLSHWLRDYVYFSLPGLRSRSRIVPHRNMLITMALCGIWHGAGWTFLIWGLYHGVMLVSYRLLQPLWRKLQIGPGWMHRFASVLLVQQIIVFGWVLLRIQSISDIKVFLSRLADFPAYFPALQALPGDMKAIAFLVIAVWLGQFLHQKFPVSDAVRTRPWNPWAMSLLLLIGMAIVTFKQSAPMPFLYFKF